MMSFLHTLLDRAEQMLRRLENLLPAAAGVPGLGNRHHLSLAGQ